MRYFDNSKADDKDLEDLYNFHIKNGILFQLESMLSCSSNEADMMYDHYEAIQRLNDVYVHFPTKYAGFKSNTESFFILFRKLVFHFVKFGLSYIFKS